MTKYLDHYKFSAPEIARHTCKDCGTNVVKAGDYCMLSSEIWEKQLKLSWDDNLCLACVERRLGRALTMLDFISVPSVEGYPTSKALLARIAPEPTKKKRKPSRTAA